MRVLGILLLFAAGASAGEYVVFASGSRLRVDRHEFDGAKVRLYTGEAVSEVAASQIQAYEQEEHCPEPTRPPAMEAPAASGPTTPATPAELADAAADRYGLPRWLVRGVMAAESGSQPSAVSPKGAIGLMQLMPATAQALGANPHDPAQNVDAGARYLRELLIKYDSRLWRALAAYNAGPGAVDKYNGVPPYAETINYILRIDRERRKNMD